MSTPSGAYSARHVNSENTGAIFSCWNQNKINMLSEINNPSAAVQLSLNTIRE